MTMLLPLTLALLRVLVVERGGPEVRSAPDQRRGGHHGLGDDVARRSRGDRGPGASRCRSPTSERSSAPPLPELRATPQAMVVASSGRRVGLALRPDRRGAGGRRQEPRPPARRDARLPGRGDHGRRRHRADPRPGFLDEAASAPAHSRGERRRAKAAPPKVLVVDDQFTVRELQRSILEAAGYRVETARDGREALARVTGEPDIALVVTDVEMPEDGRDRAAARDPRGR